MTLRTYRLAVRVAVVTGAANGIGRAFARKLAHEGASVAVVDLVDGAETVDEIVTDGGKAVAFVADVSNPADVRQLAGDVRARFGKVDILVNNAGIYPYIEFADLTLERWRHVFAVNVESVLLMVQAFVPDMQAAGWGRIINTTSNSVHLQVPGAIHYVASKMAVMGLTRGLATEFGTSGITVNAIAPSVVRTPGTASMPDDGFAALAQMQSIKRVELPDDLTGIVAFLASDDAAFITGQTIYVDGGMVRTG